jgi:hypothetical protein
VVFFGGGVVRGRFDLDHGVASLLGQTALEYQVDFLVLHLCASTLDPECQWLFVTNILAQKMRIWRHLCFDMGELR